MLRRHRPTGAYPAGTVLDIGRHLGECRSPDSRRPAWEDTAGALTATLTPVRGQLTFTSTAPAWSLGTPPLLLAVDVPGTESGAVVRSC